MFQLEGGVHVKLSI